MTRNYRVMCDVLQVAAKAKHPLELDSFDVIEPRDRAVDELRRLSRDGLLDGVVRFAPNGTCLTCTVTGLSDEGREFWRLVENESVRALCIETLTAANVDVSYPLLKEVCEDIVKRYVIGFIPKGI